MVIEIVDLSMNSMVIFNGYVSLPEGTRRKSVEIDKKEV